MNLPVYSNTIAIKKDIMIKLTFALLLSLFVITNSLASQTYGPVKAKDFLGKIVRISYPDSTLTNQQIMVAILRSNPEAFRGGNIHFLKQGVTLNLPDVKSIASISQKEATTLIAKHLTFFKEGKTGNFTHNPLPVVDEQTQEKPAQQEEPQPLNKSSELDESQSTENQTKNAPIPAKIKIEVNEQRQKQDNKLKHVKSLEEISSQQNKTLSSLDEQIRTLEALVQTENGREEQKPTQKPEDEQSSTKQQEESLPQDTPTQSTTEPEETSTGVIENTTNSIEESRTPEATAEVTTSEAEDTSSPLDFFKNPKNTKLLALISAFVFGLFALLYFLVARKKSAPPVSDDSVVNPNTAIADKIGEHQENSSTESLLEEDKQQDIIIKKQPTDDGNSVDQVDSSKEVNEQESEIKINMARAYMDLGFIDTAKESLEEVLEEGTEEQKEAVQQMLSML